MAKIVFIPGINAGMTRKEACTLWIRVEHLKRHVCLWQKRPERVVKEAVCGTHFKVSPAQNSSSWLRMVKEYAAKESCICGKRALYLCGKRALCLCGKGAAYVYGQMTLYAGK